MKNKKLVDELVEDEKELVESEEKKRYRAIIEAYKAKFPKKWENGKKEELLTKLNAIK